jgi:hypothetical protein
MIAAMSVMDTASKVVYSFVLLRLAVHQGLQQVRNTVRCSDAIPGTP